MLILLAALLVYVPNQLHFPEQLGLPGLNVFNLLLLMALGALYFLRRTRPEDGPAPPRPPLTRPLLVFYAVLGLSLVIGLGSGSPHPLEDITIYKTVISYSILYFIAYYGVRGKHDIRVLLAVIAIVFLVAAFEAVREGIQNGFGGFAHSRRAAGPFSQGGGNANYAGVFYSVFAAFFLSLAIFGTQLRRWQRLLLIGMYLVACVAVFATFSRQSFLILAVTTLLIGLKRNFLLGLAVIVIIANYTLWAPEGVIKRVQMTEKQNAYGEEVLEDSAESRYLLWDGAIDITRNHPSGVGFNRFKDYIDPYMPSWVTARDAQNQYLLIVSEAGIQGLFAYLWLLGAMLVIGLRLWRLDAGPEARSLGFAFSIAMLAVVMGNIYSSTFFSGEVMGNIWILAGLLSRYTVLAKASESPAAEDIQLPSPLERARRVYARWQPANPHRRPLP